MRNESARLDLTPSWHATLCGIVPALLDSAHTHESSTDRARAREAAIDVLSDAARKLDAIRPLAEALQTVERFMSGEVVQLKADPAKFDPDEEGLAEFVRAALVTFTKAVQS